MSEFSRRANYLPAVRYKEAREQFGRLLKRTDVFLAALGAWTCEAALAVIDNHPEKAKWRERYVPDGWRKGSGLRGVPIKVRSPLVVDVQSITVRQRTARRWRSTKQWSAQLELAASIASRTAGMGRLEDNWINTHGQVASPWVQGRMRRSTLDIVGLDERMYYHAGEQRQDYARVYVGRLVAGLLVSHTIECVAQTQNMPLKAERPVGGSEIAGLWLEATGAQDVSAEYMAKMREYYLSPGSEPASYPALPM